MDHKSSKFRRRVFFTGLLFLAAGTGYSQESPKTPQIKMRRFIQNSFRGLEKDTGQLELSRKNRLPLKSSETRVHEAQRTVGRRFRMLNDSIGIIETEKTKQEQVNPNQK